MGEAHNQPQESCASSRGIAGLLQGRADELRLRLDGLTAAHTALQRRYEALSREHTALRTGVAKASHELKNAVTTILIIARRLGSFADGPLTEDQRALVETLAAAGRNIASLVEELVAQLRGTPAGSAPVLEDVLIADVARRLRLAYSVQAQRQDVGYDVELLAGVPATVRTDGRRLDQILDNLVSNALKFTRSGQIQVRFQHDDELDELQVVVSDTGIGIAESHRSAVFEPFRRIEPERGGAPGGMGLGLAISRDLARQLGGDITLASEPGKGSVFTLHLPLGEGADALPKR